jgi:ribosomal protein L28
MVLRWQNLGLKIHFGYNLVQKRQLDGSSKTKFDKAPSSKGQAKSKRFFQANLSSKKQTNEYYFTTWLVFTRFLEEIEDIEKTFGN